MPSAVAEAEAAAMDNAVDVWRLNTASRLHGKWCPPAKPTPFPLPVLVRQHWGGPYASPRRMRRAVAPTTCRSMPGVSDCPEKRFRYSAVAPDAVPLSGGGVGRR
nr:MAG TPA: hypothetical protein [Caudoviricetes sp.]